jgi:beta-lactamase class A
MRIAKRPSWASYTPTSPLTRFCLIAMAMVSLASCGAAGTPRSDPEVIGQAESTTTTLRTPIPIGRSPTPMPTPTITPIPSPTQIPYSDEWNPDLAQVADRLIDAEEGVFGVVFLDRDGEVLYSRNSETPFITASLYKLVLMADILKRVEQGELTLDQEVRLDETFFTEGIAGDTYWTAQDVGTTAPIRELLLAVSAYSSNVSARSLLQFTTWESLTLTARQSGMERTYFLVNPRLLDEWPPAPGSDSSQAEVDIARQFIEESFDESGPVNLSTPKDMASYQFGLLDGTVVSPYVSEQLLSMQRYQQIDDRIPALLDDRFTVAHKPGNLIHVVHDVGIIYTPSEPRVLAAMSEALIWDGRAHELIQRLALIATNQSDIPPISAEAMVEGGGIVVEFAPPPDPSTVVLDPEVIVGVPTPEQEATP